MTPEIGYKNRSSPSYRHDAPSPSSPVCGKVPNINRRVALDYRSLLPVLVLAQSSEFGKEGTRV
jgi:hypothetical protein